MVALGVVGFVLGIVGASAQEIGLVSGVGWALASFAVVAYSSGWVQQTQAPGNILNEP